MSDKQERNTSVGTLRIPPSPVLKRGTSSERRLKKRHAPSTRKENRAALAATWTHPVIKCKPKYYPLAKTHHTMSLVVMTIQELLKSLTLCLKAMSCFVKYCNNPASAYVLTWEHVELQIALWKTQTGDGVIIEVIYRRGDPIAFHKYAHNILDAAQGNFDSTSYERQYGQSLDIQLLKESELLLRSQYPTTIVQDKGNCTIASLATIYKLLTDDCLTARIMGMESLCVLTDPRKTSVATSVRVARIVLQGEGPNRDGDRKIQVIHDYVINLIQNRDAGLDEMADLEPCSSDSEDSERPIEMQDSASLMHGLALAVMCHALEAIIYLKELFPEPGSEQESVVEIIQSFLNYAQKRFGKNLIQTLVNGIFKAEEEPHIACHCTIGLRLLCDASGYALQEAGWFDALNAANHAYRYGSLKHAKLAVESDRFLQVLHTAY